MKILLIDDDRILTRHYGMALEVQGYTVTVLHSILSAIAAPTSEFDLCVVDLMIDDEGLFNNRGTQGNLITGLRLVETIRDRGETTPCVILTNLNIDPIWNDVESRVNSLADVTIMKKSEFTPTEFSQVVIHLIKREGIPNLSPTLGRRLAKAIIFQPNIGGIGVDFKVLFGMKKK